MNRRIYETTAPNIPNEKIALGNLASIVEYLIDKIVEDKELRIELKVRLANLNVTCKDCVYCINKHLYLTCVNPNSDVYYVEKDFISCYYFEPEENYK